jgi:hypothetical protein
MGVPLYSLTDKLSSLNAALHINICKNLFHHILSEAFYKPGDI